MNIVQGRGNNRRVISLPHGSIFAQGAKNDWQAYVQALNAVCDLTLGNPVCVNITPGRFRRMSTRTEEFTPPTRRPIRCLQISQFVDKRGHIHRFGHVLVEVRP